MDRLNFSSDETQLRLRLTNISLDIFQIFPARKLINSILQPSIDQPSKSTLPSSSFHLPILTHSFVHAFASPNNRNSPGNRDRSSRRKQKRKFPRFFPPRIAITPQRHRDNMYAVNTDNRRHRVGRDELSRGLGGRDREGGCGGMAGKRVNGKRGRVHAIERVNGSQWWKAGILVDEPIHYYPG